MQPVMAVWELVTYALDDLHNDGATRERKQGWRSACMPTGLPSCMCKHRHFVNSGPADICKGRVSPT